MQDVFKQKIIVTDRAKLEMSGVKQVISFNELLIILETNMGIVELQGENMHISQLSLEQSEIVIEGTINILEYSEDAGKNIRKKGKSILDRMLK